MTLPAPVTAFLEAVGARNADAVANCFTEDASYALAVPHPPLQGREAVRATFADIFRRAERVQWDVMTATTDGDRVWLERVDRFWFSGGEAAIECAGVVELADGLISSIRDYADLDTWRRRKDAVT